MATFTTAATRGTLIDGFPSPELLEEVTLNLSEGQTLFRTHILISRRLGSRTGETSTPTAQRVRCLRHAPTLGTRLDDDLAHAFRRAIGQILPQARRASRRTLSAFVLENGATLRLDLASDPAFPTDVVLTFICRPGGGAEAMLRVWCGPLTGCSQLRSPVHVQLKDRQAALIPALWPSEILPRWTQMSYGEPFFAVVVPAGVETS
jgi:hypothetical protein